MSQEVMIRASFGSYEGKPVGILSMVMDIDGKPTLICTQEETPPKFGLQDGFILITDLDGIGATLLFDQTQFITAIEAYKELKAKGTIVLEPSLQKHDVSDSVQIAGLKDSGRFNYQVQNVGNGAAAILATALYFKKYCGTQTVLSGMKGFMNMLTTV
ncbi:hypothetical protein ADP71_17560 [Vitreoscilla sp. C1]|uniref:hypothetical protein n=1 Tax=Vitreoscilla sp. (strain C1) TaxID=96942 RepID=UPI000CDBF694|nr:hypothetical protein [Vitreoscilla sp. C1]AUZ05283.1 hypothetical protein ADP71_17560 [Vitreoscilla sp. C1]